MKKFISIAVLLLVGTVTYGQNYTSPVGLYNYESFTTDKYVKALQASKKDVVIRKAKTAALVRYNGDYSSLRVVDAKGEKVKVYFSEKYRGYIIPIFQKKQEYHLEVNKGKQEVFYHKVTL